MIQYLLGALPKQWRERFEEMLFTEQEQLERLRMVEDKLVDDYVNETLTAEERQQFEKHYLTSERRRQKVALALALKKSLADLSAQAAQAAQPTQSEITSSTPLPPPTSGQKLRQRLAAFLLRLRTRFRIGALMLALLLLGGGLCILALLWRLPRTTEPVSAPSSAPTQTTQRDDQTTLELQPGALPNEGRKQWSLRDRPRLRLKLALPQPPSYAVWRILVTTVKGTEVARSSGALEHAPPQQSYVTASLATGKLTAGDYFVQLQGQTASEDFRTVATYAFRLTP